MWSNPANLKDTQAASICLLIFGSVMPFVFEQLSNCVKLCTPSLKKKKNKVPAFAEGVKNEIVKPLKQYVTSLKEWLMMCSEFWK